MFNLPLISQFYNFQETSTSTTTPASQNEGDVEMTEATDKTQATSTNANDEMQATNGDGNVHVETSTESSGVVVDVTVVMPNQEATAQSAST